MCLWLHLLKIPVRAYQLPYVVCNILRSHQKRTSRTKVMKNQRLSPIWAQLVLIFNGIFSTLFFVGFEPFLTKMVSGSNFQEIPKRGLGVFQTNVVIWPYKICILTGSAQNPAPKRICTLQAHPVPHSPENTSFEVSSFNYQQMLFLFNKC